MGDQLRDQLLYGALPALLAYSVLAFVAEFGVRRIRSHVVRVGARVVSSAAAFGLSLFALFPAPLEIGTWYCPVCGAMEHRTMYRDLTVERDACESPVKAYAEWLATTGPLPHEHGWIACGCHIIPNGNALCMAPGFLFHESLPLAPDPDLARGLVLHLARAPASEQFELLLDFQSGRPPKGLFERIASHEPLTSTEFAAELETWLGQHPMWR